MLYQHFYHMCHITFTLYVYELMRRRWWGWPKVASILDGVPIFYSCVCGTFISKPNTFFSSPSSNKVGFLCLNLARAWAQHCHNIKLEIKPRDVKLDTKMISTYTCFTQSHVVYIYSGNLAEIVKGESVVFPTTGLAPPERGLVINLRDCDMINKKSIFVLCI